MKYRFLIVLVALVACFSACKKDETGGNGKPPVIDYIRTPYPEQADSAIYAAEKLQTIVIIGSNLQAVNSVRFDDDAATLNPTYITSHAIILSVPFSENHTYKLIATTADGYSASYDFETYIPAPRLNSLKCEYVPDGQEVVINGSFFYEPLTVWFRGATENDSIEADIVSFDGNKLICVAPQGSQEGPITVQSKYGIRQSLFRFRDKTNLIIDFNHGEEIFANGYYGNPWKIGRYTDENGCDGAYLLIKREQVAEWFWSQEDLAGCYWDQYQEIRTPFLEADKDITKYGLRFEANILTWTDQPLHFWFEPLSGQFSLGDDGANTTPQAQWAPWLVDGNATTDEWTVKEFKTDGWETFTIPLTDFKYDKLGPFSTDGRADLILDDMSKYKKFNVILFGKNCDAPNKHDVHICLDNPRIVLLNPTE